MRVKTVKEIEIIADKVNRIVIFAAGEYGRSYAYHIAKVFKNDGVYCYYDNKLEVGTEVRNGVYVHDLQELYTESDEMLVFIAVGIKLQPILIKQLEEHNVNNIIEADEIFLTNIMSDIYANSNRYIDKFKDLINDKEYLEDLYSINWNKKIDLDQPMSFNEKLNWLKLNDRNPLYHQLVDKYEVKQYVRECIGEEYVIPTIGIYKAWEEIDFGILPVSFVVKCTHDSGSAHLVRNKNEANIDKIGETIQKKLRVQPYFLAREWAYRDMLPRIIIEPYIVHSEYGYERNIEDYKFFCYNGKMKYILIITDRQKGHGGMRCDFYDSNFIHINGQHKNYPNADVAPCKPQNLEKMVELVEILAQNLKFVRIDMYSVGEQIYFGEYTFYPGGGMEGYPDFLGADLFI